MKSAELDHKAIEASVEASQKVVVIGSKGQAEQAEGRPSALRRCLQGLALLAAVSAILALGAGLVTLLMQSGGSDKTPQMFLAPSPAPAPAPPTQGMEPVPAPASGQTEPSDSSAPAPAEEVKIRAEEEPSDSKAHPRPCVQGAVTLSVRNASGFIADRRTRLALKATIASTSRHVEPDMVQVDSVHLARRLLEGDSGPMMRQLQVDYTILVPAAEDARLIASEVLAVPAHTLTAQLASDMVSEGAVDFAEGAIEVTNVTGIVPVASTAQLSTDVALTVLRIAGPEDGDDMEGSNRTSKDDKDGNKTRGDKDGNKTRGGKDHGKSDGDNRGDHTHADFAMEADPTMLAEQIRSTILGAGNPQTGAQHATVEATVSVWQLLAEEGSRADLLGGIVRLAFHDAGTWDASSATGGADGCVDLAAAENRGLESVIAQLEPIAAAAAGNLSRADVWVLAANVAIESAGGPRLHFEAGRVDRDSCAGLAMRLPDAEQGELQMEQFFVEQLKLSAREGAALLGAHVLGSAEAGNSGYSGAWVPRNDRFSNDFFRDLLNVRWDRRSQPAFGGQARTQWDGRGNTMMLNTDIELAFDTSGGCTRAGGRGGGCPRAQHAFSTAVSDFATQEGERAFFETFAVAWRKMAAFGSDALSCPFEDCSLPVGAGGPSDGRGRPGNGGRQESAAPGRGGGSGGSDGPGGPGGAGGAGGPDGADGPGGPKGGKGGARR